METSVFFNLLLSALLVVVTIFYAWQQAIAAREMKTARAPHVDVDIRRFGRKFVAYVRNVGGGPALNVSIALKYESPAHKLEEHWERSLLPGEEQVLLFPNISKQLLTQKEAVETAAILRAEGSCVDVRGERWSINKTIELATRLGPTIEGEIRGVENRYYSNIEGICKALESIASDMPQND
jgi:hypothetical protein